MYRNGKDKCQAACDRHAVSHLTFEDVKRRERETFWFSLFLVAAEHRRVASRRVASSLLLSPTRLELEGKGQNSLFPLSLRRTLARRTNGAAS